MKETNPKHNMIVGGRTMFAMPSTFKGRRNGDYFDRPIAQCRIQGGRHQVRRRAGGMKSHGCDDGPDYSVNLP
jgi:hypothetical protein